jgi:thymidylate synthase ThyX
LLTCNMAQWEIREMSFQVLRTLKREDPVLFKDAGATCVRGYCNETNGPECPRFIAVVKSDLRKAEEAKRWLSRREKDKAQSSSD